MKIELRNNAERRALRVTYVLADILELDEVCGPNAEWDRWSGERNRRDGTGRIWFSLESHEADEEKYMRLSMGEYDYRTHESIEMYFKFDPKNNWWNLTRSVGFVYDSATLMKALQALRTKVPG